MTRRQCLTTIPFASGVVAGAAFAYRNIHPKGGVFLDSINFVNEGSPRMNTILGSELDGRLFTDLSSLAPDSLITPTPVFYIRTRASTLLPPARNWRIRVQAGRRSRFLLISDLTNAAKPVGLRLLECAGNTRAARFGMISVADWKGVPVSSVLDDFGINGRVRISGFDHYAAASFSSVPGASWIFAAADLRDSGAFLATAMNGAPLTPDHGAPVRLVVPGWYGCCSIKWVDEIAQVEERAEPTSQMIEYARRTNQTGSPNFAADFTPAVIDTTAIPIRIERWNFGFRHRYRIVGICWGGGILAPNLEIRFNRDQKFVPVEDARSRGLSPWNTWAHWWEPPHADRYEITLRAADPEVRTTRLNSGYYARTIQID